MGQLQRPPRVARTEVKDQVIALAPEEALDGGQAHLVRNRLRYAHGQYGLGQYGWGEVRVGAGLWESGQVVRMWQREGRLPRRNTVNPLCIYVSPSMQLG